MNVMENTDYEKLLKKLVKSNKKRRQELYLEAGHESFEKYKEWLKLKIVESSPRVKEKITPRAFALVLSNYIKYN